MKQEQPKYNYIIKALVGSRCHGLATPESDYDFRSVFLTPTKELLTIGAPKITTNWSEDKTEDSTAWELGHFLFLATKCNPTILEVFLAPKELITDVGTSLVRLFPRIWNSKGVMDAFIGYGRNQRKKFLDQKDNRPHKYATAYLRTLIQAYELLTFGTFTVDFSGHEEYNTLLNWKNGQYSMGEVIEKTWYYEDKVRKAYEHNPDKKTDFDQLNSWLLKVRKSKWN